MLKNQNIKIIKKKFYIIFNRIDEIDNYFTCLNDLLINIVRGIREKINKEEHTINKNDIIFEKVLQSDDVSLADAFKGKSYEKD